MNGEDGQSNSVASSSGSSSNSNSSAASNDIISKSTFFLSSAGIVSLGALYGVRRVMTREKEAHPFKNNVQSFHLGFRALGWGTVLCFGTFGLATVAFSLLTGIRSPAEFAASSKRLMVRVGLSREITEEQSRQMDAETKEFLDSVERGWDDLTSEFHSRVDSISVFSKKSKGVQNVQPTSSTEPRIDDTK